MALNAVALSLASVIAVSLVSLVGLLALSLDPWRLQRLATSLVSFAVGALLGDAFIHLIPATFADIEGSPTPLERSLSVLLGILLFFVVEKLVRHRHGVLGAAAQAHGGDCVRSRSHGIEAVAVVNVLGDAVHNFIDGVLIGASYLAGPALGVSTTVAVLLHEIPQELAELGVLVHSGASVKRAVRLNLATASMAILGTGVALLMGAAFGQTVLHLLLPITAGGFVYLAAADLIPELQRDRSLRGLVTQTGLMAMGILVMAVLTLVE